MCFYWISLICCWSALVEGSLDFSQCKREGYQVDVFVLYLWIIIEKMLKKVANLN